MTASAPASARITIPRVPAAPIPASPQSNPLVGVETRTTTGATSGSPLLLLLLLLLCMSSGRGRGLPVAPPPACVSEAGCAARL
jgi:hypothetical protein